MKSLEKKLTGIYVPGYRQSNHKKFDSLQEEMILDVLDTDEDRIMYSYKSTTPGKMRSQQKHYPKNNR